MGAAATREHSTKTMAIVCALKFSDHDRIILHFDILFSAEAEKIKSSMQSYRSNHACKGPSNLAIWHWQSGNPAWEDWGNCAGTELGAG